MSRNFKDYLDEVQFPIITDLKVKKYYIDILKKAVKKIKTKTIPAL